MSGIETGIGLNIVAWFQSWGVPVASTILLPLHYIGGEYGYLVLLPIVYWSVSKYHGKRLMVLSLGSALIASYLKFWFRRPRPYQVAPGRITPVVDESGFGIPSGHTLFATVTGGYLWQRFPRAWVQVVAVIYILLMGISRMIHGVHFPQDVLAGIIVGIVILLFFSWAERQFSGTFASWPLVRSFVVIAVIAAAAFALALLVERQFEERKGMLSVIGAMIGGLSGFALESRYVRFSCSGGAWNRILRTLVGLAITVGIFVGLDLLYDVVVQGATGLGAMIVYTVRYGLVALFVAVGAPAIFVRTGLAAREPAT